MKTYDAIVFDFDGTLAKLVLDFDLMRTKIAALGEAFLAHRPVPDGRPALEWVDALAAQIEQESNRDSALEFHCRCRLTITAMEIDAAKQGCLFDFTRPVLDILSKADIAVAVITRNITPAVRTVFPDIDDHVAVLLAREDTHAVKPDPAHLHLALDSLGIPPDRALMVGDHPMDIITGRRAGTHAAGVTSGRTPASDLAAAGADFVLDDISFLPAKLGLVSGFGLKDETRTT